MIDIRPGIVALGVVTLLGACSQDRSYAPPSAAIRSDLPSDRPRVSMLMRDVELSQRSLRNTYFPGETPTPVIPPKPSADYFSPVCGGNIPWEDLQGIDRIFSQRTGKTVNLNDKNSLVEFFIRYVGCEEPGPNPNG